MMARYLMSLLMLLFLAGTAQAHFGMLIPSSPVADQEHRTITIQASFSHPFGMEGMILDTPVSFSVLHDGAMDDVLGQLAPATIMEQPGFQLEYTFTRPGVYGFAMEPQPYWEPAEDCHIIHYTKVMVPAYGVEEGWDALAGFPVEILPLTRPFGNYVGGVFTGQVLVNGEPAADVEVEVELYNQDHRFSAPTPYHETMLVKTDANGVFSWSCTQPGWWGFAALVEGPEQIADPDGVMKGVELGGVLWIYMHPWSE